MTKQNFIKQKIEEIGTLTRVALILTDEGPLFKLRDYKVKETTPSHVLLEIEGEAWKDFTPREESIKFDNILVPILDPSNPDLAPPMFAHGWAFPDGVNGLDVMRAALSSFMRFHLESYLDRVDRLRHLVSWSYLVPREKEEESGSEFVQSQGFLQEEERRRKYLRRNRRLGNIPLTAYWLGLSVRYLNGGTQVRFSGFGGALTLDYYPTNGKTHIVQGKGKGKRSQTDDLEAWLLERVSLVKK